MASPEAFALAYLGNALWQVPLVALAATGLARGLYGLSPSVQHRLALAALALAVALPLAFHPAAVPLRRLAARTRPALSRFRAPVFPAGRPSIGPAVAHDLRAHRPPQPSPP
ncbi:MAG TPA: hypothetical protein VN783_00445 [Thermoanaerobaculia bacterium]|nr:hypothetical protein [Thermoanaerobaculia bacterium]